MNQKSVQIRRQAKVSKRPMKKKPAHETGASDPPILVTVLTRGFASIERVIRTCSRRQLRQLTRGVNEQEFLFAIAQFMVENGIGFSKPYTPAWHAQIQDLVEMRAWRGKRSISRTVVLLVLLSRITDLEDVQRWLEKPNPNLSGEAPIDLLRQGRWTVLADFIDDMLTGAPT